jgi:large subunit ribosomal protein L24
MKIKSGDNIIMIAGKDRGQKGKVLKVLPGKLVVEGINLRKKHERARREGQKGQVVEKPAPVAVSNALLFCSSCGKGVRIGAKIKGDKKTRVCRQCGKEI